MTPDKAAKNLGGFYDLVFCNYEAEVDAEGEGFR